MESLEAAENIWWRERQGQVMGLAILLFCMLKDEKIVGEISGTASVIWMVGKRQ